MAEHIQIGNIVPRIQYLGDGAQTQYTYPFPIFAAADMEVYLDQTKQATGFTVNGAGDSAGGDVTFDAAPAAGVLVTLRRRLAIQRTSDFQESGEFRSKVINDELDYLTAALQQVSDDGERALRLTATDPTATLTLPEKATRANMFLAFDDEGDAIASDASGPPGPPGPAGNMDGVNNLSELADPAAARGNLGLGAAAVESVAAGGSAGLLRADGDGSALTGISASDDVARANIVLNAFRIAVQGGLSVQNMVGGVVDEFEDETGVDTGTSTNEAYDAGGDFYSPTLTYGSDVLAGGTASASSTAAGAVSNVVDNNTGTSWQATNADGHWWKYDLGAGNAKTARKMRVNIQANRLGTWTLAGSNDDAAYTTLATGNETGSGGGWIEATFLNTTAYRYYRLTNNVRDGATAFQLQEMEILEKAAADNMTLVSNAATAAAQPGEAFIAAWQQDVDAVTPNTDLKAHASRDGGTTWTQITLVEEAALSTGRILTGSANVSGQPAGTSMKWKLETANAKEMKIHGVGLEWS